MDHWFSCRSIGQKRLIPSAPTVRLPHFVGSDCQHGYATSFIKFTRTDVSVYVFREAVLNNVAKKQAFRKGVLSHLSYFEC